MSGNKAEIRPYVILHPDTSSAHQDTRCSDPRLIEILLRSHIRHFAPMSEVVFKDPYSWWN
jgi:hypothetical protein